MMLRAQNERPIAFEAFLIMLPYARLEEHKTNYCEAKINISSFAVLFRFRKKQYDNLLLSG